MRGMNPALRAALCSPKGTASPPTNQAAPAISSADSTAFTAQLTCSTGTWLGTSPITYAYQWKLASDDSNLPGTSNAATYTPSDANWFTYAGAAIYCAVTATNAVGSATHNSGSFTLPLPTPSFVGVSAEVETSLSTVAFTLPAGVQEGDIMLVTHIGGGTLSATGWAAKTAKNTLTTYYKRAGAGESNPTLTKSDGAVASSSRLLVIRYCRRTGDPFLQSATAGGETVNDNSGTQPAPAVTTTEANEYVIQMLGRSNGTNSTAGMSSYNNASLVSCTKVGPDQLSTTGRFILGHGVKATAGSSGTFVNSTGLGNSTGMNAISLALGKAT